MTTAKTPPRVWVMRIRSGPTAGTATSWDGPPSDAYVPYVPASLLAEAERKLAIAREALDRFRLGHGTIASVRVEEALAEMDK